MVTQDKPDPEGDQQAGPDPGDEWRGDANVAAALAAFDTFRDELNALICEARAGETAAAKKLAPVVSELARAVSRIADERVRLGVQLGRTGAGRAGDANVSLDLAAARAEVCRRLAELRNARQRDDVS